jgi:GT2 family glycosyltransferase
LNNSLALSVIIPTFNRAKLLNEALQSLSKQSLPRDRYEIIVVNDGSTDSTIDVCKQFALDVPIRLATLNHAGTSAAKNLGVFLARSQLVLFFDDDDVATERMLEEHVWAHATRTDEQLAVLGFTKWAPLLGVTPLMRFIVEKGFLFSYGSIADGQELGYQHFWAGRISCKRSFLTKRGIFRQQLTEAAHEDVELGFRLSRHGLKILCHWSAVQYMNRALTFVEFCSRCEKQGRAQGQIVALHTRETVRRAWPHWEVNEAESEWPRRASELPHFLARVQELEALLESSMEEHAIRRFEGELFELYSTAFRLFRIKGAYETLCGVMETADHFE